MSRTPRPLRVAVLTGAALALVALSSVPRVARAEPPKIAVPKVDGLALDGKTAEEGWAKAVEIPAEMVGGAKGTLPKVRVAVSGARLFLAVDATEDPGGSIGVIVLAAPDGAPAAQALQMQYAPQDLRAPRWIVRGPKGTGRSTYRVAGAADVSRDDAWSIELALPLTDLGVAADKPMRLAVIAKTRTPNVLAQAPGGAVFRETKDFALLTPPEGGWPTAVDVPPDSAIAAEDLPDAARIDAWHQFQVAQKPYPTFDAARKALLAPLDDAIKARPDMALLHLVRAQVLEQTGETSGLEKEFTAALAAVPHLPEAEWALEKGRADAWTTLPDTQPSDYDAAFAKIAAAAKEHPEAIAPRIAEGMLRYRHGDFDRAVELLGPIAERYRNAGDDNLAATLEFSKQGKDLWEQETLLRQADARKEGAAALPRARLHTSKGDVLVELFEDDAPNTVANFVYLAKAGFYDKTKFHRVIPFFMVQGGDPLSATLPAGAPQLGTGGPGWAIPTQTGKAPRVRRHWRGVLSMANSGPDTDGSQFFVTTATTRHLDGVHAGQDVVDHLLGGDVLTSVEIVSARDHDYHPTTVAGVPAGKPVPTAAQPRSVPVPPAPPSNPPPSNPPMGR